MQFTKHGALGLWRLVQKHLDLCFFWFLEDFNENVTKDERGAVYWKGVASFLREWADALDAHADELSTNKKS